MWAMIEWGKILMHCKNTTFTYHYEFNKYIMAEEATSEDVFDYLFDIRAKNIFIVERKEILEMGSRAFRT